MKTLIFSLLLALACVTGLSAATDPPDESGAVSYCYVDSDNIQEHPAIVPNYLPLPCVLEVATFPPKSTASASIGIGLEFTRALNIAERLQGYASDYSTTPIMASCGGLSRLSGKK